MADHPLRSATDRRLGRPLPHQLANQSQAHPLPINLWPLKDVFKRCYEVLIPVSRGYPSAKGRLPTCYSPVRRFPLPNSTEASFASFSLDLHVLGTPPAFILSQDQTLILISFKLPKKFKSFLLNSVTLSSFANSVSELLLNRNCRKLCFPFQVCIVSSYLFSDSKFLHYEVFNVLTLLSKRRSLLASLFSISHLWALVNNFFELFYLILLCCLCSSQRTS